MNKIIRKEKTKSMENSQITESKYSFVYHPYLVSSIFLLCDVISLAASFFLTFLLRLWLIPLIGGKVSLGPLIPIFWILLFPVIGLFLINGLYPAEGRTGVTEIKEIVRIITISYIVLGLVIFMMGVGNTFSRSIFIFSWLFSCIFVSLERIFLHNRGSLLSWWNQPVIVVGKKKDVSDVITRLLRARRMSIKPALGLIFDQEEVVTTINGITCFPDSIEKQLEIRNSGIGMAVYAGQSGEMNKKQKEQLRQLALAFPKIIYVMSETPLSSLSMKPLDLEGRPAFQVQYNLLDPWSKRIKRVADLIICFTSAIVSSPLFIILALLIRLDSKGPAVFVQKRMGKDGKIFDLYKFRTMDNNAEEELDSLLQKDEKLREEYQKYHKLQNDPRITKMGRFLRKTSLDEFPQFWNVIRGEMSLVGPRAYIPSELEQMGESAVLIERVLPGLTGWWQVMGRHDVSFQYRLRLDEYYISNFSLWIDFYIMVKTIWVIISGKGA